MLITTSYFFGDILIGQLSEQSVRDKVKLFIEQREPELLEGLLGYATYKAFTAGLLINPIDPKWTDLRDGKEYTDQYGQLRKWKGLIQPAGASDTIPKSLIAYYIFYWYQRSQATKTSGTGESIINNQNAEAASLKDKMVLAWNTMRKMNVELYCFLEANKTVYTDWYAWMPQNACSHYFKSINAFGY